MFGVKLIDDNHLVSSGEVPHPPFLIFNISLWLFCLYLLARMDICIFGIIQRSNMCWAIRLMRRRSLAWTMTPQQTRMNTFILFSISILLILIFCLFSAFFYFGPPPFFSRFRLAKSVFFFFFLNLFCYLFEVGID